MRDAEVGQLAAVEVVGSYGHLHRGLRAEQARGLRSRSAASTASPSGRLGGDDRAVGAVDELVDADLAQTASIARSP